MLGKQVIQAEKVAQCSCSKCFHTFAQFSPHKKSAKTHPVFWSILLNNWLILLGKRRFYNLVWFPEKCNPNTSHKSDAKFWGHFSCVFSRLMGVTAHNGFTSEWSSFQKQNFAFVVSFSKCLDNKRSIKVFFLLWCKFQLKRTEHDKREQKE